MKLAIYIHSLCTGGAERVAFHLANFWSRSGFEVIIITNQSHEEYPYPIDSQVKQINLDAHGYNQSKFKGIIDNIKRCHRLRKSIVSHEAEVVLSMGFTANVTLAFALFGLQVKTVGSERNYPAFDADGVHWHFLRKYSYRWLDTVVVQTEKAKEWIQSNTNAKKVEVLPNPVVFPLASQPPIVEPYPKFRCKILLGVGRLQPQKQFDHLITAFSALAQDKPEWHLVIVGEGEQRACLGQSAKKLLLSDRIHFPGKVGNIADWYRHSDAFALTSKYEGFPNVLIEAMSHGLPVVSYDCDAGPSDVIESGVNGLLVKPDDIEVLIESLSLVMNDQDLRKKLGCNALRVKSTYGTGLVCDHWTSVVVPNSN